MPEQWGTSDTSSPIWLGHCGKQDFCGAVTEAQAIREARLWKGVKRQMAMARDKGEQEPGKLGADPVAPGAQGQRNRTLDEQLAGQLQEIFVAGAGKDEKKSSGMLAEDKRIEAILTGMNTDDMFDSLFEFKTTYDMFDSDQQGKVSLDQIVQVYKEHGVDLHEERDAGTVSYTHLRAHETPEHLVCRLLLEKKKKKKKEVHTTLKYLMNTKTS
eukprot:TRINITY_DN13712_c0_g1_i4.p1 TRINITY_DN13712_c0_g1~~TRINITY_DN13712_c0_g1_i4.p1  ORF type:complete len:214 (-),score=70.12 TRINITY_DN13712_c0_g1_i4:50-691(-)